MLGRNCLAVPSGIAILGWKGCIALGSNQDPVAKWGVQEGTRQSQKFWGWQHWCPVGSHCGLFVALHHGTGVQVRQGQKLLSERLLITSGVRQGCVLAPALFCVAIDWILRHMKDKSGIDVGREHFSDLVYADDTAFLVNTTSDAVSSLSSFQDTASALGLQISWPKTKLQNLGAGHQPPPVSVDGNAVDSVDSIVYLGSLLSSDGYCRPDINRHISYVCSTRHLEGPISVRIYQALVQSVLLYAAETWTPRAIDIKALEACTWSVRDSRCRSAGNSSSEMTRLQRPLACCRCHFLLLTSVTLCTVVYDLWSPVSGGQLARTDLIH